VGCVAPDFKATELQEGHGIRVYGGDAEVAVPYFLDVGGVVPAQLGPSIKVEGAHGHAPAVSILVKKDDRERVGEVHPIHVYRDSSDNADIPYDAEAVLKAGTVAIAVGGRLDGSVVLYISHWLVRGNCERRPDKGPRVEGL